MSDSLSVDGDERPTARGKSEGGVSVFGLGKMGLPMARNLREAGFRVVGYDVSEAACERARAVGVEIERTAREAAATTTAGLVVVGLDEQALDICCSAENGLLVAAPDGFALALCSTLEVRTVEEIATAGLAAGVEVIDATLCRGEPSAEDGSLLVLCGGPQDVVERLRPVFSAVGEETLLT